MKIVRFTKTPTHFKFVERVVVRSSYNHLHTFLVFSFRLSSQPDDVLEHADDFPLNNLPLKCSGTAERWQNKQIQ